MKEVIFVGWISKGKTPMVGETMKNQYIIEELQKNCNVILLDFYQKNTHPWIYIQAIWIFITHPKASIILSTSAKNVYSMLKLFKVLGVKRDIIHWVVGGAFGNLVKKGRFDVSVFNYVKYNLVQCHDMITQLEESGIRNALYVSNFKRIHYYPSLEENLKRREQSAKMRFVFLSRIHPAKGCNYIFAAIDSLNKNGYESKFVVDFYGKYDQAYKKEFIGKIKQYNNATYHGVLNLRENKGYDILATYQAMLFPTFHPSEGFAGIFIDAFIAGIPVLASDWAYNPECIENGETGIIYPTHNVDALTQAMEDCITGKIDLQTLARNARKKALKYEAENVINKEFLKKRGLID